MSFYKLLQIFYFIIFFVDTSTAFSLDLDLAIHFTESQQIHNQALGWNALTSVLKGNQKVELISNNDRFSKLKNRAIEQVTPESIAFIREVLQAQPEWSNQIYQAGVQALLHGTDITTASALAILLKPKNTWQSTDEHSLNSISVTEKNQLRTLLSSSSIKLSENLARILVSQSNAIKNELQSSDFDANAILTQGIHECAGLTSITTIDGLTKKYCAKLLQTLNANSKYNLQSLIDLSISSNLTEDRFPSAEVNPFETQFDVSKVKVSFRDNYFQIHLLRQRQKGG